MARNFQVVRYSSESGRPELQRTESSRRTATRKWKRLRQRVLDRDGHHCQIRGPRCLGEATEVDHIVSVHRGGQDSEENARAVCVPCHRSKTAKETGVQPWQTRSRKRRQPVHPSEAMGGGVLP